MNTLALEQSDFGSEPVPVECAVCGDSHVRTELRVRETEIFVTESQTRKLSFEVPVRVCEKCGFEFTDHTAEAIEDDTVRDFYRLLTAGEIVSLRKRRNWSQRDFADLTGIGVASIARWETRAKMQSVAYDNLMRLADNDANIAKLKQIAAARRQAEQSIKVEKGRPKFRCIEGGKSIAASMERSNSFKLF